MQVRTWGLLGRRLDKVCSEITPAPARGPLEVRANHLLIIRFPGIANPFFIYFPAPMFNFPKPAAPGGGLFGPGAAGSTGTSGTGAPGSSLFSGTTNAAGGAATPSATGTTTLAATGTSTGPSTLGVGLFGNTKPADSTAKPATSPCKYRVMMKSEQTLMNRSLHPSYVSDGFLYRHSTSR